MAIPNIEGITEASIDSRRQGASPASSLRAKTLLGHSKVVVHLLDPTLAKQDPQSRRGLDVARDPIRTEDARRFPTNQSSFVALDAMELARRVCERVRSRALAKEVNVILRCACTRVWAHPQAFAEALYELLNNAVRATRRHYPVIVDVRNTGDGDVLWQIQDGGEGMSEQVLAELGEPSRDACQGGPGLGVAYAWAVIEKHGGLLRFESEPGVGTTASIWLPEQR